MAGRIRSFSESETETLRKLARDLKKDKDWSSTRLGEAMGIAQQNAARFVAAKSTSSIDRTTANALAIACGFRDVEHALLDAGTMAGDGWAKRRHAQSIARSVPYPEAAINAVMHRYAAVEFKQKSVRWWMDRISLEAMAHAEEIPPAAAESTRDTGTEG